MTENGTIIRSIEEITISARLNMQDMINKAMQLGKDFSDAKELLGHGKFLPWLEKLGVSSSTASNYMRVAREITPGSRMASLPYSKALALLAAPAEEREELAAQAEDKSAAEIRRLIEERNRAAEAANAETARADQAEKDAKQFNQENANLRNKISVLENEANKDRQYIEDLKAHLLIAENNRVEVEVEKIPEDYERIKKQLENAIRNADDLIDAAATAEQRAANAEAELEAIKAMANGDQPEPAWKIFKVAMTRFMTDCEMMPLDPAALIPEKGRIEAGLTRLERWTDMMRIALAGVLPAEGAVE